MSGAPTGPSAATNAGLPMEGPGEATQELDRRDSTEAAHEAEKMPPLQEESDLNEEAEDLAEDEEPPPPVMECSWEAHNAACPRWGSWWRQALAGGVGGTWPEGVQLDEHPAAGVRMLWQGRTCVPAKLTALVLAAQPRRLDIPRGTGCGRRRSDTSTSPTQWPPSG